MGLNQARSTIDDHQDAAGADRRLLDDAAPPACGEGEQLAPLPVAEFGAADS
ncbi:hypothetical protein OHB13_19510 [Streptomyces sp. NBC_00440]|uniref:hypothetical protein n=1 Tax=Streptomyces sp. NBC_00440 TaxID=2975741 RepID=UPI002E1AF5FC